MEAKGGVIPPLLLIQPLYNGPMNSESLKGMVYAVVDHSHTDRIKTQRVLTRYQESRGQDDWDACALSTTCELEIEDMRKQSNAKRRHAHKRVLIVKVIEVFDVVDDDGT